MATTRRPAKTRTAASYCPAQLGPDEADNAAERLEELAAMVESGYRPPAPTKRTRARQQVELLLQEERADRRERIGVGVGEDHGFPLTPGELLKLLVEADLTLSYPPLGKPCEPKPRWSVR